MPVAFPWCQVLVGAGLALAAVACQSNSPTSAGAAAPAAASPLTAGTWRGVLSVQGQQLPFLFDVTTDGGSPSLTLRNGEERLKLDEITTAGDSTTIKLGVFDAALVVRAAGAGKLTGAWVKYDAGKPYRVPLTATSASAETALFTGDTPDTSVFGDLKSGALFRTTFREDDGQTYPAVGFFTQDSVRSDRITGTFLTTTGDYRYLSGNLVRQADGGEHLKLATFDGSHGFLFDGKLLKPGDINQISGDFYSGLTGHETWTATLDPTVQLPDANALSGLKPGQKKLTFSFPNVAGSGAISPADAQYRGKVVVVQILGSWCPNCMDETNFLAPWYQRNKQRGVEVIGLGYERASYAPDAAMEKLRDMRQRLNVDYAVAYAGVGTAAEASKSLPQLTRVLAFPTTIFLDKKGEVRKIHTGFSGPGTGKYYEQEKADFNKTVDQLLAE